MNDHDRFMLAQKCINEIDDYLEYASDGHVRDVVMQSIDKYADAVQTRLHESGCALCDNPLDLSELPSADADPEGTKQ